MPDWNAIAKLGNQIGTAAGSLVAGIYGGPAAAGGVQLAGGVVGKVIDTYVPGETPAATPAGPTAGTDTPPTNPGPLPPPQADARRAYGYLVEQGWHPEYAHQVTTTGQTEPLARYDGRLTAEDVAGWVLLQAGWGQDSIESLLAGPLVFWQSVRPQFSASPSVVEGYAQHDHDGILAQRLHRDTEPAGYAPELYHGQAEVHEAGIGTLTERVSDTQEEET